MDFSQLLQILRRQWRVAAIVFLLVLAAGYALTSIPAKRYVATTTVLVQPNLEVVEFGQVQVVEFLLPSLGRQVESKRFAALARRALPPRVARVEYDIEAETDPGTSVLDIKVETTDKTAAVPIANEFAAQLLAHQPASRLLTLTVLDPATAPPALAPPTPLTILMASVVLGVIAAVFTALAMHALRRRLQSADEIRSRFGASVIGEIPRLPQLKHTESPTAVLQQDSDRVAVEAFHRLRTNMELALLGEGAAAVTVTSVKPSEGKSTVVAILGWVLASAGHKVILVDADLRRPSLHEKLGQRPGPGVAAWAGAGSAGPSPLATALDSLTFVPAGTADRHPAEVITDALPKLLVAVERPGRLVLIDAPPLEGVAETNVIAAMTKAVVLVVDAKGHDAKALEHAMARLHEAGSRVVGVVINRSKLSRADRQVSEYYGPRNERLVGRLVGSWRKGHHGESRRRYVGASRSDPRTEHGGA